MAPDMVTTALELPGHEIVANVGVVRGIVVRSRSIVGSFLGGLQTVVGGNITIYTNLCEQARRDAFLLMCAQADGNRAHAIVAVKYDTTEIMRGVTEVLCYGSAVRVKRTSP